MKENSLTIVDKFLFLAQDPRTAQDVVIEYGAEQWTYGDLDLISTGLARELQALHGDGLKPVVVSISENRPYVLAMVLATWKLGGIFAPLDCHAPPEMVKKMIQNIEPTCALLHEHNKSSIEVMGGKTFSVPLKSSFH
jgi:acyl-coenzyme A synthetase/AMP-(fatty) acid ligase